MEEYRQLKQAYPNELLLFRIGEFYEAMGQDAEVVHKTLGLTFSSRSKENKLCGVPAKSLETYLKRLLCQNLKVVVAEEESTEVAQGKKQITRVVKRIYTKGTLIESELTEDEGNAQYLLAILRSLYDVVILAWLDLRSNELVLTKSNTKELNSYLLKIDPCEIIVRSCDQPYFGNGLDNYSDRLSIYDPQQSVLVPDPEVWETYFGSDSMPVAQEYLGTLQYLLNYLTYTNPYGKLHLGKPRLYDEQKFMHLSANTIRQLECITNMRGEEKYSLFSLLNKTCCPEGKRLLKQFILHPLIDYLAINRRLDAVEFLYQRPQLNDQLRQILNRVGDLERMNNKIYQERANLYDLLEFKRYLQAIDALASILDQEVDGSAVMLKDILTGLLGEYPHFAKDLELALNEAEIEAGNAESYGINLSFDVSLQEKIRKRQLLQEQLDSLEAEYTKMLGIPSLKLKQNRVIGYFLELPPNTKLDEQQFLIKQRSNSFLRVTTAKLLDLEASINLLEDFIAVNRQTIVKELLEEGSEYYTEITRVAKRIAILDVLTTFAHVAQQYQFVRPIVDASDLLEIRKGRHPIVEHRLGQEVFVANDCCFAQDECCKIITGSNMAGKSTYLRQVALICLMAQIGCFVPAESAHLGVRDQIFTRIGAEDDISNGQSTFMLEMLDVATILNQATHRSLVIVDELGRGTSYRDGLAIAEATLQYLTAELSKAPYILFATHYHSLAEMSHQYCYSYHFPLVKNSLHKLIFSHCLTLGAADNSYGIEIAKLAGFPETVLKRAEELLTHE